MKQKKKMSLEDAIKIVDSRNEIPREDDWELAKEELLAWVQEKVVPLYEAATNNLKKFDTNYYWKAITPMFYVEIVEKATGNIESRMGPMGERKADRTETGASINLNHDKFFTRIVPANSSDDRD